MVFSRTAVLLFFSYLVARTCAAEEANDASDDNGDKHEVKSKPYAVMHKHYDELGEKDGLVSYDEIKRALGTTTEDEWKKEIEPHDDGDMVLDGTEFENWLRSFRKTEL